MKCEKRSEISKTPNKIRLNSKDFYDESIFANEPVLAENWKGKRTNSKNRTSGSLKPKAKLSRPEILSNGNIISSGIKNIRVNNTCAFDTVVQALLVGFTDHNNLKMPLKNNCSELSIFLKTLYEKDYLTNVYKLRTELLMKYFKHEQMDQVTHIQCECNVYFIVERILLDSNYYVLQPQSRVQIKIVHLENHRCKESAPMCL